MEHPIDNNYQALMVPFNYEQDYFNSFPPGYRFCPTDEELLFYYLTPKVRNQPLPRNRFPEVKLYDYNPKTLTENYEKCGDNVWYFFTSRNKKYPHGNRPSRSAGRGFWKATGADKTIFHVEVEVADDEKEEDNILGYKKVLVYYKEKSPKGEKTNWIMHEFRVSDKVQQALPREPNADPMLLDEWVLCKIYYKSGKESNENGEPEATTATTAPPAISQPEAPVAITTAPSAFNHPDETPEVTLPPLPPTLIDYSITDNDHNESWELWFPPADYYFDEIQGCWVQPVLPGSPSGFGTPALDDQDFPHDHQHQQPPP